MARRAGRMIGGGVWLSARSVATRAEKRPKRTNAVTKLHDMRVLVAFRVQRLRFRFRYREVWRLTAPFGRSPLRGAVVLRGLWPAELASVHSGASPLSCTIAVLFALGLRAVIPAPHFG